ncbi:MAG: OmpH family outer membrane protein [Burkholderiaceae bacterium]
MISKLLTTGLASALMATMLCVAAPARAQGMKLGFVNTERILRDAPPALAAQKKLETEFKGRDKELQSMATRLKADGEKLERDRSVLSSSDLVKRQRDFADLEKEFQRKQRQFREDVGQRRNEELAQVLEQANRAIRELAEKEKYDLIVQEAVYNSPRIDITEKILKALGK